MAARPYQHASRRTDVASAESATSEFEGLIRHHYSRAYSSAYRLMGNACEAEDLTQEAFMRAWAAFDRYDRSRPFEGWLTRILSRLAIDRWRRQSQLSICSLDAEGTTGGSVSGWRAAHYQEGRKAPLSACLAEHHPSALPEPAYLRGEMARQVRQALCMIPDHYRTTVILADVWGYSYDEIAQQVGCPVGTVRSRLHRARRLLRNHLVSFETPECSGKEREG